MIIRHGTVEEVISIANQIPEFSNPYEFEEYSTRLKDRVWLALVCEIDQELVGFKLGYGLSKKEFYTWFGGVVPKYRGLGVAKSLATKQEEWVRQKGFAIIRLKTRNYLKPMLIFALSSGFFIKEIEERSSIKDHRIILVKNLNEE